MLAVGGEPLVRYGIALAVAVLLIGAGALYVRQVTRSVEHKVRQALREAKAAGQLPPEIDPEQVPLVDFGVDLPASEILRVKLAHLLVIWRFVLVPMVLLGSLGIARMLRQGRP
jgi:hypothetical protein